MIMKEKCKAPKKKVYLAKTTPYQVYVTVR